MTLSGQILGVTKQHYPIEQPRPGYSEQAPEVIYQAFIKCISGIIQKVGNPPAGVSLSSAMHSLIPVNERGNALSPMITWADTRSESIAQAIRASKDGEWVYRTSGTPIHAMAPLGKIIWLKEHQPALFSQTHQFISIKEYIWYKLFGQFQIDYSIASATGLFDIRNLCWSEAICSFAGIAINQLAEPVDTNYWRNDVNPAVADLLSIPADTPFIIGASDGCCANLGTGATTPGVGALTIGTSGAVRISGNTPVDNFAAMTFNYLLNATTFVSGGAVNNGGIAVDWLLKNFLNKTELTGADYDALFAAIETIPAGSEGLMFLPYLYGERAPLWDAKASGAFLNIKPLHTQAHFLRAGLEGICFALNNILATLETASAPVTQLNVSGGFVGSPVWMQLLADITGKKLALLQVEDASAIGAVYLALPVIYPGKEIPAPVQTSVIMPDMQRHEVYAKTFPIFKKLYGDMKDSLHLLNQLKSSV
jgi:gluconokinase